jgi:hypothetical protein
MAAMSTWQTMTNVMDIRVRDRYIEKGKISLEDVAKSKESLPDLTESCEWVDYEKEFAENREDGDAEGAPAHSGFAPAPPNPGSLV